MNYSKEVIAKATSDLVNFIQNEDVMCVRMPATGDDTDRQALRLGVYAELDKNYADIAEEAKKYLQY